MTDIILHDIDPLLLDRIKRIAATRSWPLQEALMHLLEHGLFACEAEMAARFSETDASALQAAINALEGIPSDPGFSLIGRMDRPQDVQAQTLESSGLTDVDRDLMAYAQKS